MPAASSIETVTGSHGILLPDVPFEKLPGYDPLSKVQGLFRLFAMANRLIDPIDETEPLIPAFEYEFVVPATNRLQLAVVRGRRTLEKVTADQKAAATKRDGWSGSSRGYRVASETHALVAGPIFVGRFSTVVDFSTDEYRSGWASGGAGIPDNPRVLLVGDGATYYNDPNAESGARKAYEAFYHRLGVRREA